MNWTTLDSAEREAKRFLDRVKALKAKREPGRDWMIAPKERGAVRRASMDLTRALADLRRWS